MSTNVKKLKSKQRNKLSIVTLNSVLRIKSYLLSREICCKDFQELEGIELGKPCQLFKLNERNRTLCTEVDYFYYLSTGFRGLLPTSSGAMESIALHLTKCTDIATDELTN